MFVNMTSKIIDFLICDLKMEVPKHIKTMRSVSSPPGMPPLSTSTNEPSKTPSYTKPSHSTDLNIRHSKGRFN
ncbi:UNVERIFIED_CONTAM: hypothetical protein NCL1_55199 [Trichonephila clavipes]